MPSVLLGNPFNSGAQPIFSGNMWSGQGAFHPVGGVQLRLHPNASGNAYITLSGAGVHPNSGGATITSGGFFLSGSLSGTAFPNSGLGWMDGMIMTPGDSYFVPKTAFYQSGTMTLGALVDPAGSGQARLFFEAF